MIRYDRLWNTMEAKSITQYRLIKQYNFSAGQIGRLKKNMHVSTHTLDTLCTILNCDISDIIEYIPGIPDSSSPDVTSDRETPLSAPASSLPKAAASVAEASPPPDRTPSVPSLARESKQASSPAPSSSVPKKADSPKNDKQKKTGKSKKGDKKASKEGKKSKDGKKNK